MMIEKSKTQTLKLSSFQGKTLKLWTSLKLGSFISLLSSSSVASQIDVSLGHTV